jgi:hypothetical protein
VEDEVLETAIAPAGAFEGVTRGVITGKRLGRPVVPGDRSLEEGDRRAANAAENVGLATEALVLRTRRFAGT